MEAKNRDAILLKARETLNRMIFSSILSSSNTLKVSTNTMKVDKISDIGWSSKGEKVKDKDVTMK